MLGGVVIGNPKHFLEILFKLVGDSEAKEKQFFLNTIR